MWREEDIYGSLHSHLKFTGFLHESTLKNKMITRGLLTILIFTLIFHVANLFIPSEVENYLASTFEAIASFLHITAKIATLVVFQVEFQKISNDRQNFWQLDCMGMEMEIELKKIRTYFSRGFKTYIVIVSFAYLALVVKAMVFNEMPYPCWVPEGKYWSSGVLYYQFALLTICVYVVTIFDFMFTASYMDAFLQFKLLNSSFSKLEIIEDIEKCKDHQNFIFGYIKTINEVFSMSILVQYFLTIGLCCMLITLAADPKQNSATIVKSVIHLFAVVVEIGFFCSGPSFVQDESDNTIMAVWHCDWYKKDLKFQKYILLVLTCSKSISVSGAGIVKADRIAFINVFKSIFSVYTLIRASTEL